jgi:RimJ/RimL family protein N-acetyltransferase
MELKAPLWEDTWHVREWRNKELETLRTPYRLTEEMQSKFFQDNIATRQHHSRWWSVYHSGSLVAFAGLTDIEWENGLAEISLIVNPQMRGCNYGNLIVDMILNEAFGNMGLKTVYGECYECNSAIEFWQKVTIKHGGYYTMIPRRKLWQGQLYDALHFSIWR